MTEGPALRRIDRIRLMISTDRHLYQMNRAGRIFTALAFATCLISFGYAYRISGIAESPQTVPQIDQAPGWPAAGKGFTAADWSVFAPGSASPAADRQKIAGRFRLAGTFFAFAQGMRNKRKAVLDRIADGHQLIVSEKDRVEDVDVLRIFHDHVVLKSASGNEEELWLGFSAAAGASAGSASSGAATPEKGKGRGSTPAIFGGKQVGKTSWVFKRENLLDYYQELRNNPTRLYAVFQSLKPIYGEYNRITGYQLGIEGEKGFFDAVGFHEGDIVRKVNSVKMSNRKREIGRAHV